MQVCALRCIQSPFAPFLARGLGDELHQLVVAILRGMLPKISPGRFQCLVPSAQSGQQLPLEAVEVVGRRGPDMALPVDGNPAVDPRQRLIRLACGEQCAESQAVLRSEPGLPVERDVSRHVPLRQIDRAQYVAPLSVGVTGLLSRCDGREARRISFSNAVSPALSNAAAAAFSI